MIDFKPFNTINPIGKLNFSITQKIHGTNAQVLVFKTEDGTLDLLCGSRNRWITPEQDNFDFAKFVYKNKEAFLSLGPGRYDGEWAGPGINNGEGLQERTFILFDHYKFPPQRPLPPQCMVVPVLHKGAFDLNKIDEVMNDLKANGSRLVPGFMQPEGIVVDINGSRYKKVFKAEETAWKSKNKEVELKVRYLCQPVRLEKLLSRDEQYSLGYPHTLQQLVSDYIDDLIKENQITGTDKEIESTIQYARSQLYKFIKCEMDKGEE